MRFYLPSLQTFHEIVWVGFHRSDYNLPIPNINKYYYCHLHVNTMLLNV